MALTQNQKLLLYGGSALGIAALSYAAYTGFKYYDFVRKVHTDVAIDTIHGNNLVLNVTIFNPTSQAVKIKKPYVVVQKNTSEGPKIIAKSAIESGVIVIGPQGNAPFKIALQANEDLTNISNVVASIFNLIQGQQVRIDAVVHTALDTPIFDPPISITESII